ncbi:MAG: response regulator [Anaerolineae bacterium]
MGQVQIILIVEDEHTVREILRRYLEREGYSVLEAENGDQALGMLREHEIDAVLLDIMLPGLDGFTLTRQIRTSQGLETPNTVPILVLTSRTEEEDRLLGFELGLDDYIPKPFSPREVVARIKAVLRRTVSSEPPSEAALDIGELHIDPPRREVRLSNKLITLTVKEFDLLWFLAKHRGKVFTREQLLDQVWGYAFFGDSSTVTVHIRRLREKIEPDAATPKYILTVWGVGYKFSGDE